MARNLRQEAASTLRSALGSTERRLEAVGLGNEWLGSVPASIRWVVAVVLGAVTTVFPLRPSFALFVYPLTVLFVIRSAPIYWRSGAHVVVATMVGVCGFGVVFGAVFDDILLPPCYLLALEIGLGPTPRPPSENPPQNT